MARCGGFDDVSAQMRRPHVQEMLVADDAERIQGVPRTPAGWDTPYIVVYPPATEATTT